MSHTFRRDILLFSGSERGICGKIGTVTQPEKFATGIQSIHARKRMLKKGVGVIHDNIFIVFFIIKNLFIRQLPVIIDQIEVFPWMKGKGREKEPA